MIQFFKCMFGKHGRTVTKEYLGFMDLYDMEVCEFCEIPTTGGKEIYERLDKKYGYKGGEEPMPNKGFTLIELIIVIGIISILAAIAIPQLNSYRSRGYDADVISNMKNMLLSQETYFVDTGSYADGTGTSQIFLDRGFRKSANVATVTTNFSTFFTIVSNAVRGCSPGTGVWSYTSATGARTGTRCN